MMDAKDAAAGEPTPTRANALYHLPPRAAQVKKTPAAQPKGQAEASSAGLAEPPTGAVNPVLARAMSGHWRAHGQSEGTDRERKRTQDELEDFILDVCPDGHATGYPAYHVAPEDNFSFNGSVETGLLRLEMTQVYTSTGNATQWSASISGDGMHLKSGRWSGSCVGSFFAERIDTEPEPEPEAKADELEKMRNPEPEPEVNASQEAQAQRVLRLHAETYRRRYIALRPVLSEIFNKFDKNVRCSFVPFSPILLSR